MRYLATAFLAATLTAIVLAFNPDAHLIAGKPHGSSSKKLHVAERNLAHAKGACRAYRKEGRQLSRRSHCRAIPWLERVRVRVTMYGGATAAVWTWWLTSGARCVKNHEGAWHSNTGNGFYGGFQADLSFQRAYGPEFMARWGTANGWPPWAQITMAYRGWRARGWYPWPTTSRICGLL